MYVDPKATGGTNGNNSNQNTGKNPGLKKRGNRHAMRRIVFGIGRQARYNAANPKAFLEWIDGGLVSHRKEAVELVGEDSVVGKILERLQAVASTATAQRLAGEIDQVMGDFERGA